MIEPTMTTHYELKITINRAPNYDYQSQWQRPFYCKTLEEAKELRDTLTNMLKLGADTRPMAYKLFREEEARIAHLEKAIYKVQCIYSEVNENEH